MVETNNQTLPVESLLWTAELGLKSGAKVQFTLSSADKDSLEDRFINWDYHYSNAPDISFFWFGSEHYFVRVNLRQIIYSRLMFDAVPLKEAGSASDICERAPAIQVWMIGQQQPLEFEADPDEIEEEEDRDEGDLYGQLNGMIADMDGDSPSVGFISFKDIDGERVYLRVADIAMIAVPHWLLKPELLDEIEEDESEDSAFETEENSPDNHLKQ
jgi:hypothetical protein